MKVLWILGELPIPPDSGAKLRMLGLLRQLAPRHSITAAVLDPGAGAESRLAELRAICHEVKLLPWRGRPGHAGLLWGAATHASARLPYCVIKYCGAETEQSLSVIAGGDFDLVQCENIGFHRYLSAKSRAVRILNEHNVEARIWQQRAAFAGNPLLRAYLASQARKLACFESWLVGQYDALIAVSEEDALTLRGDYGASAVSVVPNPVDTERLKPGGEGEAGLVVFSGAMDYAPNDDGMKYFLREIWPKIAGRNPAARLVIVGRGPSRTLRGLAARANNVTVTGWVAEVLPYLSRAAVIVVPLRMGGGSRLKILEAMALGKPIVSTSVGAEGLRVRAGQHLLIADDAAQFAEQTVALLECPERRASLARQGRELVENQYSLPFCARRLEEAWRNATAGRLPFEQSSPEREP